MLSTAAFAAPATPYFANPAPEYTYDLKTYTTSAVSFYVQGNSTIPVSWQLVSNTSDNGQVKNTVVCSGTVAPTGALFPPKTENPTCAVPFAFGEAKLTIKACYGSDCATSATKSIFKYTTPPTPTIGTWSPTAIGVVDLFSDYKQNEVITFDTYFHIEYMKSSTIHIRDNTTGGYICSVFFPGQTPAHAIPKSASCKGSYSTTGKKTVYAEICYADKLSCSAKSTTRTFDIIPDPKAVLSSTNWVKRRLDGMKGYNKPYNKVANKAVAAYYTEWSVYGRKFLPKDIPVENLTHIYHSFIGICGNNYALEAAQEERRKAGYPWKGTNDVLKESCAATNKVDHQVTIHDRDAALFSAVQNAPFDLTEKTSDPIRGIFAEYYRMKQVFPHIKILPSIGGGTMSDPLFEVAKDPQKRRIFVTSAINFIHTYDFFDGLDIDWEFPVVGGATPGIASPVDAQAFVDLSIELRLALEDLGRKMDRKYELHVTFAGTGAQLAALRLKDMDSNPYLLRDNINYFNLMTYDYYGPWAQGDGTYSSNYGHHAAVTTAGAGNPNTGFSAEDVVTDIININNMDGYYAMKFRSKTNIGVAAYGRGWDGITGGNSFDGPFVAGATGGVPSLGYPKDWVPTDLAKAQNTKRWAPGIADYSGLEKIELGGPTGTGVNGWKLMDAFGNPNHQFLWNQTTGSFFTFDTARSTEAKADMVLDRGLGGLIMWSIDGDSGTLLNSIQKGYNNSLGSNPVISNIATAAVASASSTYGSNCTIGTTHCYSATKVNDGNTATTLGGTASWSNAASLSQWVQLQWSQKVAITGAEIYTSTGYPIQDYDLQYWNGSTWVNFATVNGNTALQITHNLSTNIVTDKVRAFCRKGPANQPHHVRINEFIVKGFAL